MFNMINMDIRRMLRSRSTYIVIGFLLIAVILTGATFYSVSNQEILDAAGRAGMILSKDGRAMDLSGTTFLDFVSGTVLSGGIYAVALGIYAVLFTGADFSSGAVKNILTGQNSRWKYWASRMLSLSLYNLVCLAVLCSFAAVLTQVLQLGVTPSPAAEILRYFFVVWLIHVALTAMMQLVVYLTRSQGFGIAVSILVLGGVVSVLLQQVFHLFQMDFQKISLMLSLAYGTGQIVGSEFTRLLGLTGGWLLLYAGCGLFTLYRKDVA